MTPTAICWSQAELHFYLGLQASVFTLDQSSLIEHLPFHVPVSHLDVFLGKVSIHVFHLFLFLGYWVLASEFDKLFIDFGN